MSTDSPSSDSKTLGIDVDGDGIPDITVKVHQPIRLIKWFLVSVLGISGSYLAYCGV